MSPSTPACGVVEKLDEKGGSFSDRASFKNGSLEARGDIFEEFYYDNSSLNVLKYRTVSSTYSVGDVIPTKGDSYSYPDSFDIIVLRDETAVRVRNKKITDITRISDYKYDNYPLVNGRGFEVLVSSEKEFENFINEYYRLNDAEKNHFFAKWMNFDTYRKIVIAE